LGGGIHTLKINTETLIFADKETGLVVNSEDTKYMIISRDQKNHNMNVGNKPFVKLEQLKYVGNPNKSKLHS
jgi:hypothetical protein